MNKETPTAPPYMVSVYEPAGASERLIFTFVPKPGASNGRNRAPQFIVSAPLDERLVDFDWSGSPDDPGDAKGDVEAEVVARISDRANWIRRVGALVDQIETWARDLGWATRRVDKKLDDSRVGKHKVPALLLQEGACRILLEPVGRSSIGSEGVVDLYLMPAYDDIATLYFYNDRWNLQYLFPGSESADVSEDAESKLLSQETFAGVLAEMRTHAG